MPLLRNRPAASYTLPMFEISMEALDTDAVANLTRLTHPSGSLISFWPIAAFG
jgi:hypothetical protein